MLDHGMRTTLLALPLAVSEVYTESTYGAAFLIGRPGLEGDPEVTKVTSTTRRCG